VSAKGISYSAGRSFNQNLLSFTLFYNKHSHLTYVCVGVCIYVFYVCSMYDIAQTATHIYAYVYNDNIFLYIYFIT